jgi:hypothetical protein
MNVECRVGCTDSSLQGLSLITAGRPIAGRSITEHFMLESTAPNGKPAIDLSLSPHAVVVPAKPNGIDAFNLNKGLRQMREAPPTVPDGNVIGIILASRFLNQPELFGVMFDVDSDVFSGGDQFDDVQRQGCAVFVDAIRAAHPGSDAAFEQHLLFTAMHEIGHVFNLWHANAPLSFMNPSSDLGFPTDLPLTFHKDHRGFLGRCDADPHVQPGGSRFGSRGGAGPDGADPPGDQDSLSDLVLAIDMTPRRFWRFEPVELDLTIRLRKGVGGPVTIPKEIDPSYPRLQIWIEDPTGERRRYRPSLHACENGGTIEIGPTTPFHRDITLFRESGGYTFRRPGSHQLQAVLQLGGRWIWSNPIEVFVRRELAADKEYGALSRALEDRAVSAFLRYRSAPPSQSLMKRIDDLVRRFPRSHAAAGWNYAVGAAILGSLPAREQSRPRVAGATAVLDRLRSVLDTDAVGDHRRRCAQRLLEEYGSPTGRPLSLGRASSPRRKSPSLARRKRKPSGARPGRRAKK